MKAATMEKESRLPAKPEQVTDIEPLKVASTTLELAIEEIRKYICPNATKQELWFFVNQARALGLNPLKKEIHFVKYGDERGQIVIGYQVFLKIANSQKQLDGWNCEYVQDRNGARAVLTIYRKDWTHPFVWEVDEEEFSKAAIQTKGPWKKIPKFMLKKVAIGQGFRLCFPDMGGLPYLEEEVGYNGRGIRQIEPESEASSIPSSLGVVFEREPREDQKMYFDMANEYFKSDEDRQHWQGSVFGEAKRTTSSWGNAEYDSAIQLLNDLLDAKRAREENERLAEEDEKRQISEAEEAQVEEKAKEKPNQKAKAPEKKKPNGNFDDLLNQVASTIGFDPEVIKKYCDDNFDRQAQATVFLAQALSDEEAMNQLNERLSIMNEAKEGENKENPDEPMKDVPPAQGDLPL